MKLKDLATVSTGTTFRSRLQASLVGDVRIIQMKDLGDDNLVHLEEAILVDNFSPKASQWLKSGDLIFRSRGQKMLAALLNQEISKTIVAAPLFRIRPDMARIIPKYLLWWINQRTSQIYFNSHLEGTMIKMVSKQVLENLAINVPSIEQQQHIIDVLELAAAEQGLLDLIKQKKQLSIDSVLMKMTIKDCSLQLNEKGKNKCRTTKLNNKT